MGNGGKKRVGSSILSHWCWVLENPETAGGRSSVFSMFSHMFSEGVLGKNILNLLVFSCLASRSPSRRYTWFSRNLDDPPPNISPRHEFGLGPSKRSLLANNPRDWGHSLKKILSWLWIVWLSEKDHCNGNYGNIPFTSTSIVFGGILQLWSACRTSANCSVSLSEQMPSTCSNRSNGGFKVCIHFYHLKTSQSKLVVTCMGVSKHNGFPL